MTNSGLTLVIEIHGIDPLHVSGSAEWGDKAITSDGRLEDVASNLIGFIREAQALEEATIAEHPMIEEAPPTGGNPDYNFPIGGTSEPPAQGVTESSDTEPEPPSEEFFTAR